jgi:hypothetical protein
MVWLVLAVMVSAHLGVTRTYADTTPMAPSIELHPFRWNHFPLNVLVELNEWSTREYAVAVRRALDTWINSIWNYTHTYTNTTLALSYRFYVSTVNASDTYDIRISFTPNEIEGNIVGLTTMRWNPRTHEPITPFTITITSYSATADTLFITNIAMHEFGHALGLGHVESPETTNGPELMYPTSSYGQLMYPSTLNIYGLIQLYRGNFRTTVVLPSTIPYVMVTHGSPPPPDHPHTPTLLDRLLNELAAFFHDPRGIVDPPTRLLVPGILWMGIAVILGLLLHSTTKATLGSLGVCLIVNSATMINRDLWLFGRSMVFILPAIILGAVIGSVMSRKIAGQRITHHES